MKRSHALMLRAMIEKAAFSLSDTDALEAVELFPAWAVDAEYSVNERVRYGSNLYRCVQTHRAQQDWTPDITPSLWTEVAEPGEIPVWKQPTGAQDAYMSGDKVWYPEKDTTVYVSTIDDNVWKPGEYGWEEFVSIRRKVKV